MSLTSSAWSNCRESCELSWRHSSRTWSVTFSRTSTPLSCTHHQIKMLKAAAVKLAKANSLRCSLKHIPPSFATNYWRVHSSQVASLMLRRRKIQRRLLMALTLKSMRLMTIPLIYSTWMKMPRKDHKTSWKAHRDRRLFTAALHPLILTNQELAASMPRLAMKLTKSTILLGNHRRKETSPPRNTTR